MQKDDLTYRINGCAMLVHNKLKRGFREYIYCRALAIELRKIGTTFEREVWLPIHYDEFIIGFRRCDFFCGQEVIIEVKAKSALSEEDIVQAINTLERLNIKDGLLINFGGKSLEFKHIFNNKYQPDAQFVDITPEQVGETNDDLFTARHYLPDWELYKMQQDRRRGKF